MKRLTLATIVLGLSVLLSSCGLGLGLGKAIGAGGSDKPAAKATRAPASGVSDISIVKAKYRPKNVTVKAGTTLTWTNNGETPESVTSDTPGVFDSGLLAPGGTWKYTFSQAGTFPYHSAGSPDMFGSVTVTP